MKTIFREQFHYYVIHHGNKSRKINQMIEDISRNMQQNLSWTVKLNFRCTRKKSLSFNTMITRWNQQFLSNCNLTPAQLKAPFKVSDFGNHPKSYSVIRSRVSGLWSHLKSWVSEPIQIFIGQSNINKQNEINDKEEIIVGDYNTVKVLNTFFSNIVSNLNVTEHSNCEPLLKISVILF